jgi:hypothetical protein
MSKVSILARSLSIAIIAFSIDRFRGLIDYWIPWDSIAIRDFRDLFT